MAVALSQLLSQNNFAVSSEVSSDHAGNILLHELQLGEQLNESVVQTRRADFSLMLAMLTEDVREQSQFILPKTPLSTTAESTDTALRKQFNLPEKTAELALSKADDINQFNQAQAVVDNDLASLHLSNAMMAKPLAFRDDKAYINSDVMKNTSVFCQLKHKQAQVTAISSVGASADDNDKPLNSPLNFNAQAWLDNIEQSLVNAPLVS